MESLKYKGAFVVIPTRNRADLAKNAINSVLSQDGCEVNVLVSDNSTRAEVIDELGAYCEAVGDARLRYVRPPKPLPMSAHWEWAIQQALQFSDCNHFLYLTDRMMFKRGELQNVLNAAALYPDKIISYNHDRIVDDTSPIRVEQSFGTRKLLEIPTSHLSYLYSQALVRPCFPRMLNCVAPRSVLERIMARFGNVFASIAPDFNFCCRSFDIVDSIIFYDWSPMFHYALKRSNGASISRGELTADYADFIANLTVDKSAWSYAAPAPQIASVGNTVFNEYLIVKRETQSPRFFDLNKEKYLNYLAFEMTLTENADLKKQWQDILIKHGWTPGEDSAGEPVVRKDLSYFVRKALSPGAWWRKIRWAAFGPWAKPVWLCLARLNLAHPPIENRFNFNRIDQAINYLYELPPRTYNSLPNREELMHSRTLPSSPFTNNRATRN